MTMTAEQETLLRIEKNIATLNATTLVLAQLLGTRINQTQLAERMGVHRNTVRIKSEKNSFPKKGRDGKYELWKIIKWEQENGI
jgi:hypothetical protein